jgi:hypothetical protein
MLYVFPVKDAQSGGITGGRADGRSSMMVLAQTVLLNPCCLAFSTLVGMYLLTHQYTE